MSLGIYNRQDAARYLRSRWDLRVTKASLATMATRGGSPQFFYQGRYVYYREADLVKWAAARSSDLVDSTSTPRGKPGGGNSGSSGITGGLFDYQVDIGDLHDDFGYQNTGDPYFDEVTKLLEFDVDQALDDQQINFCYRAVMEKMDC
jgi:hypothetical protein